MARKDTGGRVHHPQRPAPRPLLPPATRPLAAAVLVLCVAVTVFLGIRFAHQSRAGWLDTTVDARVRAGLGGHPVLLNRLAMLGNPVQLTAMTAGLFLVCLVVRRWRGAALAAIAIPAAAVITELLLKPLIGRTLLGSYSFPSGHATRIFALATTVAVLLAGPLRPWLLAAVRLLLAVAALLAAGAVAMSLVGLGVHYFTDTVGGAAVGMAVVLATAFIIDRVGPVRQWALWHPSWPARAGRRQAGAAADPKRSRTAARAG